MLVKKKDLNQFSLFEIRLVNLDELGYTEIDLFLINRFEEKIAQTVKIYNINIELS